MKILRFLFALVIFAALASCSLQKRTYQSGYYVSWKKHPVSSNASQRHILSNNTSIGRIEAHVSNSIQPVQPHLSPVKVRRLPSQTTEPCDTLIFRNGTEVKAKVIEINKDEIKYKYCNNPTGPLIIVAKSDVKMIRYANGDKDEFTIPQKAPLNTAVSKPSDTYIEKQAQAALIFGIVSFFVSFFGLITAGIAISKGRNALRMMGSEWINSSAYRSARAGVILGIVYFSLLAFALLLILIALIAVGLI